MMFKTHLILGIFLGLFFAKSFSIEQKWLFVLVCAFFAILVDIDLHKSKVGKRIKPLSWLINFFLGHRGVVHSLLMAFFVYGFMYLIFGATWGAAALIGYSSHLFLDSFNVKGTKPLWPLSPRLSGVLKSNSMADYLLFLIFLLATLLILF